MVESSSDRSKSPMSEDEEYNKIELTPLQHENQRKSERNNNAFEGSQIKMLPPNQDERFLLKIVDSKFIMPDEQKFNFGEVAVHQLIETIEFSLGTISNTASYLRLWALSLAHSQLSKVFYEQILKGPIENGSTLGIIIGFPFWLSATIGVLMIMDTTECFLHVLRLHWVEFQSKFYKGEGYAFTPLKYKNN